MGPRGTDDGRTHGTEQYAQGRTGYRTEHDRRERARQDEKCDALAVGIRGDPQAPERQHLRPGTTGPAAGDGLNQARGHGGGDDLE